MTNNDSTAPMTWAERQAKYGAADLSKKAEVDYNRVRPPVKERNHSVKHRAIR